MDRFEVSKVRGGYIIWGRDPGETEVVTNKADLLAKLEEFLSTADTKEPEPTATIAAAPDRVIEISASAQQ